MFKEPGSSGFRVPGSGFRIPVETHCRASVHSSRVQSFELKVERRLNCQLISDW